MPAADKFSRAADDRDDPARECFIIAPGGGEFTKTTKGIRAGSDGTITLRGVDMATPVVHPVFAGEVINMVIVEVTASNPAMVIIGYA
jgi:hypothetical protein